MRGAAAAAAARETKSSVGGADVNQLHVTLDISAANGEWSAVEWFLGILLSIKFQDPSAVYSRDMAAPASLL